MTNRKGTINSCLEEVIGNLYMCKTPVEVKQMVEDACRDKLKGPATEQKLNELLNNLNNTKNLTRAMKIVYDFYLKGEGSGVI